MSAPIAQHSVTTASLRARKGGEPIVCLTAYDAPMAEILDPHCDLLLVGDSVGMVVHGLPSTIGVTLDMMILHGRAVVRGASRALVAVDLPFGSYEKGPAQAFDSASRVMMETGCHAVKLETGPAVAETIAFLVARGVPVIAHVGLRPQSVHVFGGFRAQGRDDAGRQAVLAEAHAADQAGAFAIVVEGVAEPVAHDVTNAVEALTIGIGASAACDGQILVTHDMLGLFPRTPKFVKRYGDLRTQIDAAVAQYANDVKSRAFPDAAHVYAMRSS